MSRLRNQIVVFLTILMLASAPAALAQAEKFDGKPAFADGIELSYYVWREGDKWLVRWTTKGTNRKFTGSVVAEGGELHDLKRIDLDEERKVLYPGRAPRVYVGPRGRTRVGGGRAPVVVERKQDSIEKDGDNRIVFATITSDDIDGFNFRVDKNVTTLRFILTINGRPSPQHVQIGKNNEKASSLPLVVRLQ